LGRDISVIGNDVAELAGAIAYALPALEIVDSRIGDWDIKMVDTIADNASSGMFVLGTQPVSIHDIDLSGCSMVLEKNGAVASEGSGAACLGNPLNALAWLASMRIRRGEPLKAGDIILSGALGPMVAATPGDSFRAHVEGVGGVGVRFAS
ncbi:MAG: 2-keto-4-pentenoate hydratase, partial [Sphingomonadaceae bacterium]